MTVYRLKKVGRYNYRKALKNGRRGSSVTIPEAYREQAEKLSADAKGEIFTLELPDTVVRRSRPRYLGKR